MEKLLQIDTKRLLGLWVLVILSLALGGLLGSIGGYWLGYYVSTEEMRQTVLGNNRE